MSDAALDRPQFNDFSRSRAVADTRPYQAAFPLPPLAANEPVANESKFNPLDWFFRALKYKVLIAAMFALAIASGLMVTAVSTPLYDASTQLEIVPQTAKAVEDLQAVREATDSRALMTARERLVSQTLAQRVVYDLNLTENAAFLTARTGLSFANLVSRVFRIDSTPNVRFMSFATREKIAIARVLGGLRVRPVPGTNNLLITVRNPNAALAAKIADQIAKSYIEQRIDQSTQASGAAREFVEEQVAIIRRRLQKSEEELVEYARANNLNFIAENTSLILTNITEINKAIVDTEKARIEYERLVQFIEQGRGADLPQVVENSALAALRAKAVDLRAEFQSKLAELKPGFPEMRALQTRITEIDKQVARSINIITDSIRLKLSELRDREKSLRARLADLEAKQSEFQDKNIRYTILKREADSNRALYQTLITKLNDIGVSSELRSPTAALVDSAQIPGGPASPSLLLNLAVAMAVATILTALIIYILELLNNTFTSPDQLEAELGLPLLGLLPKVEAKDLRAQIDNKLSVISEAYRSLRTSLQFTGHDHAPRTILVTSTEPGEGKSTTVFKLATEFAALGKLVLVIDADMRKPSLHRLIGTDHAVGLSNLLSNTAYGGDVRTIFKPTQFPNLMFVSAGVLPPNPADLLSSSRMAFLLESCAKQFDVIIIDAPPIIGLADAPTLGRLVDGVLLIVACEHATRKAVGLALKRIRAAGGVVLGAAMTKFSVTRLDYKYAYRYMSKGYYKYGADLPGIEASPNGRSSTKDGWRSGVARLVDRVRGATQRFGGHTQ